MSNPRYHRFHRGQERVLIWGHSIEDFDWKVYVSLHFKGRFFHANMTPRPGVKMAA